MRELAELRAFRLAALLGARAVAPGRGALLLGAHLVPRRRSNSPRQGHLQRLIVEELAKKKRADSSFDPFSGRSSLGHRASPQDLRSSIEPVSGSR